jgi:hypothetical protein
LLKAIYIYIVSFPLFSISLLIILIFLILQLDNQVKLHVVVYMIFLPTSSGMGKRKICVAVCKKLLVGVIFVAATNENRKCKKWNSVAKHANTKGMYLMILYGGMLCFLRNIWKSNPPVFLLSFLIVFLRFHFKSHSQLYLLFSLVFVCLSLVFFCHSQLCQFFHWMGLVLVALIVAFQTHTPCGFLLVGTAFSSWRGEPMMRRVLPGFREPGMERLC